MSDLTYPASWDDDGTLGGRVSLVAYAADLNLTGQLHATAAETQQGGPAGFDPGKELLQPMGLEISDVAVPSDGVEWGASS